MYTVGLEKLGSDEFVTEALALMREDNEEFVLHFNGEVYEPTNDVNALQVISYAGIVLSVCVEPPSFTMVCERAELQVATCDCEYPDDIVGLLFENFALSMELARIEIDCDNFAGTETPDSHYQELPERVGQEIIVPFSHLGAYGVHGIARRIKAE